MKRAIMVVDDEEEICDLLQDFLTREGYQVYTATNGMEAISSAEQNELDLALLDLKMPGMDGIEVLKRMKWIAPDCPVIMISGHATISTAMAAVKLGAFDFIEKSYWETNITHLHGPYGLKQREDKYHDGNIKGNT